MGKSIRQALFSLYAKIFANTGYSPLIRIIPNPIQNQPPFYCSIKKYPTDEKTDVTT
jgi:hypothetical protein